MKILPLAAAGALLLLGGCAMTSGEPVGPAAAPPDIVTRTVEQGGKFLAFVGPRRQHAEPFFGVPGTNFYALRSWIDTRTGETAHQLYVTDSYRGAKQNWNAAQDNTGRPLRFIPISQNEITCDNGCSYVEEFAAALPDPLLRASAGGLTVVFTSQSGARKAIAMPGDLVEKQLVAVDASRASLPTAAAVPSPGAPLAR